MIPTEPDVPSDLLRFVTALQTLVSRRNDPQDPAVVTVGSIHGGTKHNVIPDSVALQLTVRSYSDATRARPTVRRASATSCGLITPRPTRASTGARNTRTPLISSSSGSPESKWLVTTVTRRPRAARPSAMSRAMFVKPETYGE